MASSNLFKNLLIFMLIINEIFSQNSNEQQQQQSQPSFNNNNNNQQYPLPPFLYNASEEARRKFFSIAYNPNLKIVDINAQLQKWSSEQPKTVQDEYNEQLELQKQMEALMSTERQKLVKQLPEDTQKVAMKLDAIRDNLQLTPHQQMKEVSKILQSTTQSVRQDLNRVDQQLGQILQEEMHKQQPSSQ